MKILICSYKALDCLKIQCEILKRLDILNDTIIYENSPEDWIENRNYLIANHIPYIDNPGGNHAETIDRAFKEMRDDYVIVLDQDCFLLCNPILYFEHMLKFFPIDLCGDVNLCRGNQKLYPRICPWFCFVNLKFVRTHNINFYNKPKIDATDSTEYFEPWKERMIKKSDNNYRYDVGSTFFEDMYDAGAYITSLGDLNTPTSKLYQHIEGSSWQCEKQYFNEYGKYFTSAKEPIIEKYKAKLGIL